MSLLVFEAAECLMAVPASEICHLQPETYIQKMGSDPFFDLGEYFHGRESDGPWLRWARGGHTAWLRVRRIIDVVPMPLSRLTPIPGMVDTPDHTCAFLAAGMTRGDMFLLLDPARLSAR